MHNSSPLMRDCRCIFQRHRAAIINFSNRGVSDPLYNISPWLNETVPWRAATGMSIVPMRGDINIG